MTDEEKQTVKTFENFLDDISKNGGCIIDIDYQHKKEYEAMWKVLNLIEKQQRIIEEQKSRCSHLGRDVQKAVDYTFELNKEIEKKDKIISNLEFALMDMVLQFADENKDSINTMGLSALEIAFNELDFNNPMSIKEVHKRYKELAQKYYQ